MINETEIKLDLNSIDKDTFISMCLEKYPELEKRESYQRDEYYDTTDMQLQSNDFVVRVRKKDNVTMVALKSPRVYLSEYIQKRIELEFEVNNILPFEQIESQGLIVIATIEKRRIILKGDDFVIEIDELPYIGLFAEIEASNVEIINEVCLTLSLESFPKIRKNYGELLDDKLSKLGLPLRPNLTATFAKEQELFI
jgi:Adenylate cyclase, class 2 (thermophilic)